MIVLSRLNRLAVGFVCQEEYMFDSKFGFNARIISFGLFNIADSMNWFCPLGAHCGRSEVSELAEHNNSPEARPSCAPGGRQSLNSVRVSVISKVQRTSMRLSDHIADFLLDSMPLLPLEQPSDETSSATVVRIFQPLHQLPPPPPKLHFMLWHQLGCFALALQVCVPGATYALGNGKEEYEY